MRKSGVLMHITSLSSPYGVGSLGREAYSFADYLKRCGVSVWQVLPIGPTSYGDSPYQSFSTFAGNPYFIDLDLLFESGALPNDEYRGLDWGGDPLCVDYAKLYQNRFLVLRQAYEHSYCNLSREVESFAEANAAWLRDYALFMATKSYYGGVPWQQWPDLAIRAHEPEAVQRYTSALAEDVKFHEFIQYLFFKQWHALKGYCNRKGVQILGDMPIYVALDSADTWAEPGLFDLNSSGLPNAVAGVPPDCFSSKGQMWGNPLYDWDYIREDGFEWWVRRIGALAGMFDILRIDHFLGFSRYYAIPFGEKTAETGAWRKGPGMELFRALRAALGNNPAIIAEDLGLMTDEARMLLEETGFPGMKVLTFAFGSGPQNAHLPHTCTPNSVIYTGTHDNETVTGWWTKATEDEKGFMRDYLNPRECEPVYRTLVRAAYASCSNLAIAQMQDYLGLDSNARMNTPSTLGGNWSWRLDPALLTDELSDALYRLNTLYDRVCKEEP